MAKDMKTPDQGSPSTDSNLLYQEVSSFYLFCNISHIFLYQHSEFFQFHLIKIRMKNICILKSINKQQIHQITTILLSLNKKIKKYFIE